MHDSVTSSGGLQGVNKLGMPAYANIPSLHQSMLVHKGCKSICSWDRGGKDNIQAVNQLNLATWQLGNLASLYHPIVALFYSCFCFNDDFATFGIGGKNKFEKQEMVQQ